MTKEVAEKIVRGITDKIECNTADIDDWAEFWGFTKEEYEEFLDMAKKAVEQEPILDKVRAEIEEAALDDANGSKFIFVNRVNQIIDKYKTESEEETADGKRLYVGVNWQYCKNLNDINDAIANHDEDWEGLNDANDIISITYDSNHSSYVVFWKHCTESE